MNTQEPTPRLKSQGSALLVHSIFHTIQGEGPFSGVPAVFIRLGGCNLQCPGCDTKYSQGAGFLTITEIFEKVGEVAEGSRTDLVVISGGEPFRQNLTILVDQLHRNHIRVQVETNGTMAPQGNFEFPPVIVCSPKTAKLHRKMIPLICHYKYVVDHLDVNTEDGLPLKALGYSATPHVARPPVNFKGSIYIQPMDMTEVYEGLRPSPPDFSDEATNVVEAYCAHANVTMDLNSHNGANTNWCVESAMQYGYTLQLQIHKLLGLV